ncbi:MAG TPA: hypothetical protein DHW49_14430 [Anaerolineae bacterium]|nr:hypothetical protein [Anaerolineae bacterium]
MNYLHFNSDKKYIKFSLIFLMIVTAVYVGACTSSPQQNNVENKATETITATVTPISRITSTPTAIASPTSTPFPKLSEEEIAKMVEELQRLPELVARMEPDMIVSVEANHPKYFYINDSEKSLEIQKLTEYWLKVWASGNGHLIQDLDFLPYLLLQDPATNGRNGTSNIKGPIVWTKQSLQAFEESGNAAFLSSTIYNWDPSIRNLFPTADSKLKIYLNGEETNYYSTEVNKYGGITLGISDWLGFSAEMGKKFHPSDESKFRATELTFAQRTNEFIVQTDDEGNIVFTDIVVLPGGNKVAQAIQLTKFLFMAGHNYFNGQIYVTSENLD